ncbi:MAG: exodeoxyribonuclease VII small subunit [Clostridiales bacterium]|nr:exodeoxyribonuclease VII small subunit [Clostridiales bacterium]MCD7828312.1 exodeoxyribonuclease VII small subunit [Clostridiales bacterium]
MNTGSENKMTYEEAVKKLEEIVLKLEKSDLPLEETIKLYDKATKLSGYCAGLLDSAKLKITELFGNKDN